MGANATQVTAYGTFGTIVEGSATATTMGEYTLADADTYNDAMGNTGAPTTDLGNGMGSDIGNPQDPHELAAARAKLLEPVSIATTGTALDISTDGGTSDCAATVTQWDGNTTTDNITYHLVIISGAVGTTIDGSGTVTASGAVGGDGTVEVLGVSNLDSSMVTLELVTITGQV